MPSIDRLTSQSASTYWHRVTWVNGVITSEGVLNQPGTLNAEELHKSWVRTPNFWALRRAGAPLPENDFSYQFQRWPTSSIHYEATEQSGNTRTYRETRQPSALVANLRTNHGVTLGPFDLYSRLVQKARNSDFSLPVTLIEGRKTVNMVASRARSLANCIFNLRRGNLVGALRALSIEPSIPQVRRFNRSYGVTPHRTAANTWLEVQYGWKPMLNDVKNAAEALAEANLRNGEQETFSTRSSIKVERRIFESYTAQAGQGFQNDILTTVNMSRRGVWRFKRKAADLPGLFGLVNPFEVVWEIIPFSFVADWFLPIGNYLSALDAPMRFDHVGGSTGYRESLTSQNTPVIGTYLDGTILRPSSGGNYTVQRVTVSRTKLTSAPMPSVLDMTFEAKVNATRAVSAIALLSQQASRLRR